MTKLLYDIYKQFYTQYYDLKQAPPKDERTDKLIENFFKKISKHIDLNSIGSNFIESFIRWQWEYWIDKDTKRKITLNWLIGSKAIDRWLEVDDWSTQSYFADKHTANISVKSESESKSDYEDWHRKRFLNTHEGFANCIENTSLYKKCITCIRCNFSKECKVLLKNNYPLLYQKKLKHDRKTIS